MSHRRRQTLFSGLFPQTQLSLEEGVYSFLGGEYDVEGVIEGRVDNHWGETISCSYLALVILELSIPTPTVLAPLDSHDHETVGHDESNCLGLLLLVLAQRVLKSGRFFF